MSLPSNALFFDENGDQIAIECINCGWVYDEVRVIKDIKQIAEFKKIHWHTAFAYGEKYEIGTIDEHLDDIVTKREEHLAMLRERSKELREQAKESGVTVKIPKQVVPSLLAEEIVGVQPMKESNAKLFTLDVKSE
ncbi:major head protein [Vibrio phage D479]